MKSIELLDTWFHGEVSYNNTENIFRLAFKADYLVDWIGEFSIDNIYFSVGNCDTLGDYNQYFFY